MNKTNQNKQNAIAFYDLMFNQCRPEGAIEKYAGEVYIQHKPHVGMARMRLLNTLNAWQKSISLKSSVGRQAFCSLAKKHFPLLSLQ